MAINRFPFRTTVIAVMILIAGGAGYYLLYDGFLTEGPSDFKEIPNDFSHRSDLAQKKKKTVYLYFTDEKNSHLMSEERILLVTDDPLEMGRMIIKELIQGPNGNLVRTIPVGTALNAIYISKEGTAFVDFSDMIRENHPGGSQTELLTVYSIVNSITLNINEVERVKILIEGRESQTLAGHIDLTSPLSADMILVR
ncbi:MAG: spore gernimation protein [Desulfobacteraceae bacterium]|nr:MAG: spore gernimation protein [Desulfobacteraceae bacterium]